MIMFYTHVCICEYMYVYICIRVYMRMHMYNHARVRPGIRNLRISKPSALFGRGRSLCLEIREKRPIVFGNCERRHILLPQKNELLFRRRTLYAYVYSYVWLFVVHVCVCFCMYARMHVLCMCIYA